MDTKTLHVEVKDAAKGEVEAVFATYDAIDSDGDVTLPGAFTDGAPVRISAYGHKTWEGLLPVGRGLIKTTDTDARLVGHFFLNTTAGRDTFEVVKEMGELQEWSYGYDVVDSEFGERDGKRVRFLKRQKVHEVSPVLLGAGVGTRTVAAKSADPTAVRGLRHKGAVTTHETDVVSRSWDGPATVAALSDDARPSELRTVFAWVDPDGDPEAKSSYKFPHHHGVGGPANVRAVLAGIAVLNGARGGADIPDTDRKAVYDHLAAHLRDADREPPELRSASGGSTKKFGEELAEGLAWVSGLLDSAYRVAALRAEKGKPLSKVNTELLEWIGDDLKRLHALLNNIPADDGGPTDDEINSLVLASIARINGI